MDGEGGAVADMFNILNMRSTSTDANLGTAIYTLKIERSLNYVIPCSLSSISM